MTAYYNEFDPKAAAWLRELIKQGHIADGVVDERSIEDVTPNELAGFTQCHFFAGIGVWSYALRSAGWADDRPVWTGSCPCQPFSAAGKGAGFADERHLWPAFHHLISQCRPDIVFGEQVASKDGLGWLDLVHADLEATGYAFGAADLCAAGVGAPHIRQRLWWIGERLGDASRWGKRAGIADHGRGGGDQGADRAAGDAGSVADSFNKGSQGRLPGWQDEGRKDQHGHAGRDGAVGGLDNSNRAGQQAERPSTIRDGSQPEAIVRGSDVSVAHASGPRQLQRGLRNGGELQRSALSAQSEGGPQAGGTFGPDKNVDMAQRHIPSGPTNGHWRDADWLFCRDGKWRPVEPGTSPLANGAAARVGRLRGYGNAIAAPVAQTFIESVMETIG